MSIPFEFWNKTKATKQPTWSKLLHRHNGHPPSTRKHCHLKFVSFLPWFTKPNVCLMELLFDLTQEQPHFNWIWSIVCIVFLVSFWKVPTFFSHHHPARSLQLTVLIYIYTCVIYTIYWPTFITEGILKSISKKKCILQYSTACVSVL